MSLRDQNQALLKKPRCQKPLRPWPFQPLSVSLLPLSIISPMPFCRPYRQSVYDCRRISGFSRLCHYSRLEQPFLVSAEAASCPAVLGKETKKCPSGKRLFPLWKPCRGPCFSLTLYFLRRPILVLLGASPATYAYTGDLPFSCRHLRYPSDRPIRHLGPAFPKRRLCQKASFGLSLGAILNIILDPLFMFVLLPQGEELTGAALATLLSNLISLGYFLLSLVKLQRKAVLPIPFLKDCPARRRFVPSFPWVFLQPLRTCFLIHQTSF